jgi:hypothetical protein
LINNEELINIFTKNKSVTYFNKKSSDNDLFPYLNYCLDHSLKLKDYLFMELGVFTGNTFSCIRSSLPEDINLYGFDTFTGLPEDWMINEKDILYTKGTFALDYIPHSTYNTEFIVGNIENTMTPFLQKHDKKISFVHFDMDLYNPTFFALKEMHNYFLNGTVLVFDDFYNLPGWENYSFKALLDYVNFYNVEFEPLSTVGWYDGWASAAIKIINRI